MTYNKRHQSVQAQHEQVLNRITPRWMQRLGFVRSRVKAASGHATKQTMIATAMYVKEAYQAGWEEALRIQEAQNRGRRPGMFPMISSMLLYLKSKGWDE